MSKPKQEASESANQERLDLIAAGLRQHLSRYGIRHFDGEEYWEWGSEQLGPQLAGKLDRLRQPLIEGRASAAQQQKFYALLTRPKVAAVVHSMKADAICRSGTVITDLIADRKRILDVGCNTGFLTTWYALDDPERTVTGIDLSRQSVYQARRSANKLGVANVDIHPGDVTEKLPDGKFDAIVDSQTLSDLSDLPQALETIRSALADDGLLVSVPALGRAKLFQDFLEKLNSAGLFLKLFGWVGFSDIGQVGAYPFLTATSGGSNIDVDLKAEYRAVSGRLR